MFHERPLFILNSEAALSHSMEGAPPDNDDITFKPDSFPEDSVVARAPEKYSLKHKALPNLICGARFDKIVSTWRLRLHPELSYWIWCFMIADNKSP